MQFFQGVTDAFVRFTVILFLLPALKMLRAAAPGSQRDVAGSSAALCSVGLRC